MKTRHLLFATALVASLAACTNDDFTIDKQQPVADGRPTVSDVKLNFTESGADTRLAFGKNGYAWETNDTIGALLMDNVKKLGDDETWLQKYALTPYIHTSYPFTYSTADKTWSCNTKMLEGNYFFAFPWESYDGQRQVRHSLTKQEQKGVKGNVVAESYAKNQFFIGYAQIKAGTNAKDALTDVEMTSLLGAVQLRIVNTGTQTYHINKIVLKGTGIMSELTFDPTDAAYGTATNDKAWNLQSSGTATTQFNYANYTGNKNDLYGAGGDYVYNIKDGDKYDKKEALRAMVKASGNAASAQLVITGTPEERKLVSTKDDAKAVAYALIMANAYPVTGDNKDLKLDIYTDEGLVSDIDLTEINTATGSTYKAITDSKVAEISPEVANTIKVQIDDNSFAIPATMDVYDSEDLLQLIKWNAKVTGARTVTATLHKNVTLTKEMTDALAGNKNLSLVISPKANQNWKLAIAEDVAENVLESKQLTVTADIEVLGIVALSDKVDNFTKSITVAETGTVNIKTDGVDACPAITNYGTLNISEGVTYKGVASEQIENYGKMTVAKLADVKVAVKQKKDATLNVNGFMSNLTVDEDAVVEMGEGANLAGVTNNGVIRTAKDAIVAGTNNGEIVYVEGATISATGTVSYETSGKSFGKDAFKENKVNKLILKKGETKITDDLAIRNIEIAEDGALLTVADKKTLTVEIELTVKANATTRGNISAAKVVVEKDATLTNNGTITAKDFENSGVVANNGKVSLPDKDKADALNGTKWKYNLAEGAPNETEYKGALKVMVAQYVNHSSRYETDGYKVVAGQEHFTTYFEFVLKEANIGKEGITKDMNEEAKKLKSAMDNKGITEVGQTDLDEAVEAIAKDNKESFLEVLNSTTATLTWNAQEVLYHTKDAADPDAKPEAVNSAYDEFRKNVVKGKMAEMIKGMSGDNTKFVPALYLTTSDIDKLLEDHKPTMFVWKDCDLDKLVEVWRKYDNAFSGSELEEAVEECTWSYVKDMDEVPSGEDAETVGARRLVKWVTIILNTRSTDLPAVAQAQASIGELGITAVSVQTFAAYTNDQLIAVDPDLESK